MTTTTETSPHFATRYEQRVQLVTSVITENSALDQDAADALARQVLRAIDHMPEHVR